jgi:hypothetical protein
MPTSAGGQADHGRGLRAARSTCGTTDFTRIAADHSAAGAHHHGLLIAVSSRFSRRPHGIDSPVAAIGAIAASDLNDRIVYPQRPDRL